MVRDELSHEKATNQKLRDAIQGDLKNLKEMHFESKQVGKNSIAEKEMPV